MDGIVMMMGKRVPALYIIRRRRMAGEGKRKAGIGRDLCFGKRGNICIVAILFCFSQFDWIEDRVCVIYY